MPRPAWLATVVLSLLAATPASAADVVTEESGVCAVAPQSVGCLTNVYFRAAKGEANRVRARVEGAEMVVADLTATPTAGAGCRSAGDEVRCALREGRGRMWVYLSDGDDSVEMRALGVVYGGPGRDVLNNPGKLGRFARTLFGGPGNDILQGSADREILDGDAGADRIDAGAGSDDIHGGPGRDRILGGRGADFIRARDKTRDAVDCGPGRGDIARVDRRDTLRGCEKT